MITAIETLRSVAHAASSAPAPRSAAEEPAEPAPSLAGLLPQVVRLLIRLLIARTPEGSTLRLVAQAVATFLPLLDLDWLPADPRGFPQPTAEDEARMTALRQERASRRVQPDRPPARRAAWQGAAGDEVWSDLLDLTSRTLETYIAFGHPRGVGRCAELLDLLADTFGGVRPEAA